MLIPYEAQGGDRMALSYLSDITQFIFLEDAIERADAIFLPGNACPYASEEAARLFCAGMARVIVPAGRYSITAGTFSRPS